MKNLSKFKLYSSLALLFVITIVLTILAGVTSSVVSFAAEDETPKTQIPAFPKLADEWKTKIDLAMASSTEGLESPSNPFVDKRGISSNLNGGGSSATIIQTSNVPKPNVKNVFVPGGAYRSAFGGGGNTRQIPSPVNYSSSIPVAAVPSEPALTDNTAFLTEQMQEQERRALRGESPLPATQIYSINDLRPLGGVGSGRRREVLFDSPVTKQSFSVPVGTRFRDGDLESVTDDGVIFRRADGTTLFKAWASDDQKGSKEVSLPVATKNVSQNMPFVEDQTDAPLSLAVRKQRRISRKNN